MFYYVNIACYQCSLDKELSKYEEYKLEEHLMITDYYSSAEVEGEYAHSLS